MVVRIMVISIHLSNNISKPSIFASDFRTSECWIHIAFTNGINSNCNGDSTCAWDWERWIVLSDWLEMIMNIHHKTHTPTRSSQPHLSEIRYTKNPHGTSIRMIKVKCVWCQQFQMYNTVELYTFIRFKMFHPLPIRPNCLQV